MRIPAKGTPVWIIDKTAMALIKCKYSYEYDHGGHGSGYQEHYVILPNGTEVSCGSFINLFTSEEEAVKKLKEKLTYTISATEKAAKELNIELIRLKKVEAYLNG